MPGTPTRSGGARLVGNHDNSTPDGGPVRPHWLTEKQQKIWDEILPTLPEEALRKRDQHLLAELVSYIAAIRRINIEFDENPADKDLRCSRTQYTQKIQQISALFGLSPADRKRIQLETPKEEEDELTEFLS
jgi:phage terminase small subunit